MQRMGYQGNGPIGKRKEAIIEPIQPTSMHPKDKIGIGYGKDIKDSTSQQAHMEKPISNQLREDVTL
jgi:hypothetical protein